MGGMGISPRTFIPVSSASMRLKINQRLRKEKSFTVSSMMYFLFQMPMLNVLMSKYLKVLRLFSEDGNLNYKGFVFKSILFGLGVYGIEQML
jgi:hypothetical protein